MLQKLSHELDGGHVLWFPHHCLVQLPTKEIYYRAPPLQKMHYGKPTSISLSEELLQHYFTLALLTSASPF